MAPEAQEVPAPMGTCACVSVDAGLCGDLQRDLAVQLLMQETNTWCVGMTYISYVRCQLQQPAPGAWICPAELCPVTAAGMSLQ